MYISLNEKFVFFFFGVSLLLYLSAYAHNKLSYWVLAIGADILAILSKETAISLILAYFVFSILDLLIFKSNTRLSKIAAFSSGFLLAGYVLLIGHLIRGYSSKYAGHLNISDLMIQIRRSPLVIQGLGLLALLGVAAYVIFWKKVPHINVLFLVVPLCLFFFLLVLLPWQYSNYLLSPLAPLILILLYPLWPIGESIVTVRWTKNFLLCALIVVVLIMIIFPRISKMADIQKMVNHIILSESSPDTCYFFPQPFFESAISIEKLTGKDVVYLDRGTIKQSALTGQSYLIFGEECVPVALRDVAVKEEVYGNRTWRIFSLQLKPGRNDTFSATFPRNWMEKIKDFIKKL